MKSIILFFTIVCLACPPLTAQNLKKLYLQNPQTGNVKRIRAGDVVLLAYHVDYCLRHPNQNTAKKKFLSPRKRNFFGGKERILRITDSSLIFMNGSYAHFESIAGIHKLSFGKQLGRFVGRVVGGFFAFSAPFGAIGSIIAKQPTALLTFATLTTGGILLVLHNNDKISKKHILNWHLEAR